VGDAGCPDHLNLLQPRSRLAQIVEKSRPVPKEDGDDRDKHFVEESRRKVVLDRSSSAA
jgi:hypothetical protein